MAEATFYGLESSLLFTSPDTNYGSGDGVTIGAVYAGGDKAALARFIFRCDVSALAAYPIISAKLVLNATTAGGPAYTGTVNRCTRPVGWVELETTWNDEYSGQAWGSGGGDFTTLPPAVALTLPTSPGVWEIPGMADFVTYSRMDRSGIVSVIGKLNDESPGGTSWVVNDSIRLSVNYTLEESGREQHDHIQIM